MWDDKPVSRERVSTEPIAWLTTVSRNGVPSTAPVWFLLDDDDTVTIYSRDPSVRVRNLESNDRVTLHLEGDGRGGAIVVMNGSATRIPGVPRACDNARFIAKYRAFLDQYGWTPEWFADNYPTAIRMRITSVRGN
jgi:PPOX class probable F420-dependent enzyme